MFIILESQKAKDGSLAIVPPTSFPDTSRDLAESAYHTALAAAATSSVAVHTVSMLDEYGLLIDSKSYTH